MFRRKTIDFNLNNEATFDKHHNSVSIQDKHRGSINFDSLKKDVNLFSQKSSQKIPISFNTKKIKTVSQSLYTTPEGSMSMLHRDRHVDRKHAQNVASKISITMSKQTTTSSRSPNSKHKKLPETYTMYRNPKFNKSNYGNILEHQAAKVGTCTNYLDNDWEKVSIGILKVKIEIKDP
jgi:hypothetical protein